MYSNQRGSTLLISLILLLLFTIVGMASIRNIGFNQKMSSNYRDADLSFQAAEAVLREGEEYIDELSAGLTAVQFSTQCLQGDCFTDTCANGLCFSGTHAPGNQCFNTPPIVPFAEQEAVWESETRSIESTLGYLGLEVSPRFLIEFRCYIPRDQEADPPPENFNYPIGDWSYLFRVTSYASGANGTSRVMLQSTYKINR